MAADLRLVSVEQWLLRTALDKKEYTSSTPCQQARLYQGEG